jgi:bacterioferritin-associated ferredoxin
MRIILICIGGDSRYMSGVKPERFLRMYVCLCNGITDGQLRGIAKSAGCSVSGVHRALGLRLQCGKCLPMMREILRGLAQGAPGEAAVPRA